MLWCIQTHHQKKIDEWKGAIEEITTQFEEMEQDANNITEETTQFQGNIVQYEQLDQVKKQLQEAEGQLVTLKTTIRAMPPIIQITWSIELKELQQ